METKNFFKTDKDDILTITAIVGLVGSVLTDIWAGLSAPTEFIGAENLRSFRKFLLLDALSEVCRIMFVCGLLLRFALAFIRLYRDNRSLKQKLSKLQEELNSIPDALPVRGSRGWLIMIPCVLFPALALGYTGLCVFSRGGIADCLREAVCVTADLSSGERNTVSGIENISIPLYSADRGELSFGEGCTMICRDNEGNEYLFPLSESDSEYLAGELIKYQNFDFRAEYCANSGVMTEYEFCGKKLASYVNTQEEADRTFGRVPISLEVGEDYVYACRPPEMKMNTGWVILRDGELMTHHPELNEGYTVFAQYYEKLDIDQYIIEEGSYEVYFVRYGGDRVLRLSDSYMFEIEEHNGKPVNIRLAEKP